MLASKFRSSCVAVVTVPTTLTRVSVAASRVLSRSACLRSACSILARSSRILSSIFSTSLSRSASDASSVPVASQLATAIAIGGVTVSPRPVTFHVLSEYQDNRGARTTHLSAVPCAPASETAPSVAVVCVGTRTETRHMTRRNCPASCRRRSASCDRS
ncbi:hypothetical protein C8R46DRAFT_1141994 [Mycena filopes]|nr:hypothetical protein C8R46DRAFT_1141994 [Mycena filopes]